MRRGKAAKTYIFRTIADLKELPEDLIRPVCTDLMLWLKTPHIVKRETGMQVSLSNEFGWENDGKHHVRVTILTKRKEEAI